MTMSATNHSHDALTSRPPSRATLVTAAAALVSSAAFTAGCLLTQAVSVPTWRAMEPASFLEHFATAGPATGAVLFPLEIAAVALLGTTTYSVIRLRRGGRLLWAAATISMGATVALLPVYFAGANSAMLDDSFSATEVARELTRWNAWNWLRTGLAVAATACGFTALTETLHPGAE
ncbi:MAG: DUF1772 domain-containing protein [Ornithinimicrobium sp.]